MIFESLVVRDVEGERSFPRKELPLHVGTGNECQLRLPGPGGDAIAMLDLLERHVAEHAGGDVVEVTSRPR